MKDKILRYLFNKFGKEHIVSVYGIGSFFNSEIKTKSDVDVIVLLDDVELAPKKEWTHARFEELENGDSDIWLLYGDLEHYLDKEKFKTISFADWAWSVRGLKHASKLIYGEDIRDQLPDPPFNLVEIFKRAMYHLEPTSKWKLEKYKREGNPIDEKLRFTKAVFKYGFFLVASVFPDKNVFDKDGIFELLQRAVSLYRVNEKILDFYQIALDYRNGHDIENFDKIRKNFMIFAIKEAMKHLETTWKGNKEKKGIRDLLKEGIGEKKFTTILTYFENFGLAA